MTHTQVPRHRHARTRGDLVDRGASRATAFSCRMCTCNIPPSRGCATRGARRWRAWRILGATRTRSRAPNGARRMAVQDRRGEIIAQPRI